MAARSTRRVIWITNTMYQPSADSLSSAISSQETNYGGWVPPPLSDGMSESLSADNNYNITQYDWNISFLCNSSWLSEISTSVLSEAELTGLPIVFSARKLSLHLCGMSLTHRGQCVWFSFVFLPTGFPAKLFPLCLHYLLASIAPRIKLL